MQAVIAAFVAVGEFVALNVLGVGVYSTATLAYIGAAVVVGGTIVATQAMSLFEVEMPTVDTDASRQRTVKSTTEPQKIIYGEALVSGPISFIGLSGTDNSDLYQTIVLAGHELTGITDIHMDDVVIIESQINGGSDAGGNVTTGTFGPKNSSTICIINKHLGETSQTADTLLTGPFANYTSAHRGDGVAYLAMKWVLNEDSSETWDKFAPQNVKALVQGKAVYDPRTLTTVYSTNPALCVADYLTDTVLGMGIPTTKIDWPAVTIAANGCDVEVDVPGAVGAKEYRFTCNGVIFATDSHQKNINKILSSMNGNLVYSNGKYIVHAGIYEAPTETLTEDDLIGAISIKTSFERSDRFNTIKGLFIDPAQNHKSTEFPTVQLADAVARDNNEILEKEVQYPMTNSSYMAQRLSNKLIQLSDQQKVVSFPANLSALRITAGDRIQVSVEELSWSNKLFQCAGWTFSEDGGVNLTLREDSSTSYADPAINEYSTVTATGEITDAFRGVPSPSGLTATPGLKSNELNWVNPGNPSDFGTIYVYASRNANFSSAIKIGETNGTQFIHDGSNKSLIFFPSVVNVGDTYTIRTLGNTDFVAMGAPSGFSVGTVFTATATGSGTGNLWETLSPGDLRYYWVRAVKNVGTDAASRSNLEPNADPNTTVFATVGRLEWTDVAGSTGAPANNATAGAQISVNLFDADGSTVMSQADVKNSVLAQEILEVEVEAGEVLNIETGADVDIQNLGDVAIFVSDSNVTLNASINTVASNLSQLEDAIVDLTSGVSDIYIQATAPVAGVGGIPNPIPEFSRWYDSDDGNAPFYWTGSAWVSFKDAEIAENATAITNLQTSATTTNTNVTANATAIGVLDTTVIAQGSTITSISSDITTLQTTVNDAATGVSANATGLSNLTTRVTTSEGSITSISSDVTTLQTELNTAETDITTNATAVSGLDTRVTTAEGSITSQASDITALESTVDNGTTGVAANASGLTALTTRVTDTEGATAVNAGAVTTLNATYTEDLHFRTEAEDEDDNLLDLETSGTVQLQDLTDFVSGSSSAIDSLTVQTYANENGIQTQAIQLTALESTVNDPANGVVATAGALSTLSTSVTVIDGQVTTTAQDLTALTTTVGGNTATITTQSNSIDGVEANYGVKIDNNNRVSGFGLLSTTAGSTPFSEFAIVADQFSIVSPDSTADTPIQPFTVTADKIYFGADVIVSGDLISTGTISADRLQIDGVMFDTETVGGVTSLIIKESGVNTSQITENAITTARLSNDAVTVDKFANTLQSTNYDEGVAGWQILTSGNVEFQNATINGTVTSAAGNIGGFTLGSTSLIAGDAATRVSLSTADGIHLGNNTFASAPFRVSPAGALTATSATITGEINATSGTLSSSIAIGTGDTIFKADSYGIYLGNATFASAPFRVSPAGALTATSATLTGNVTASSFTLSQGATLVDAAGAIANAQQEMEEVTGVISQAQHVIPSFWRINTNDNEAPSNSEFNEEFGRLAKVNDIVITTDTTTTPDTTYGWTCTLAGVADPATEATWAAITNFMSGDLIVDGSIGADQISANAITADKISAGAITTNKLSVVGKGSSINSDPNVEDLTAWALYGGNAGTFETITDGLVGNRTIRSGATSSAGSWYNGSERLPLDPNKTYRMTAVARKSSTANGVFYAGVAAFESDGTNISGDGTQWSYGAASGIAGSTTFTRYVMEFGAGTSNTFPTNAVTFAPLVILNYNGSAGYFETQDIRIEEKISASLIVDGTITADQIDSNAIGTSQLTVGVGTTLSLADTASQVNAGLALLLNKDTFGNAGSGEGALVSVDKDGNPLLEDATTTSNGFIQWNGSKISVEAVQYTASSTIKYTIMTALAGKRGFIVFDTTKSNPFTVASTAMDVAFAYKEGAQWYYDNNSNTATSFTPTNDMVALGYLETGTSDLILKGGLINPVTLTAAAFPSDEIKSGSVGGVLITPTTIESNFVTGVSGFQLKSDGTLEAGDGTFRGDITATSLALSESVTIAKSVVGLTNVENRNAQDQAQTGLGLGTTISGGGITMSAGGAIKTTGKDSESDTTNGYFLGYNLSSTKYTFGIGDADRSMVWDGSKLNISGDSISLRTGGAVDYTSDSRYPTSVKSSAITLTSDSDYFLFDTRFQDIAFPEFLVTYNLGPLTSGTQSGLTAANQGIMDQIKVEVFYSDASSGSPSTWVSFASKTVGKIYNWVGGGNQAIYFNFRVKQVDLGGGNYRADLDTRSGILGDYPLSAAPFSSYLGGTTVPVGLVDEDYNINIPVYRNALVLPKGMYFIKTVITVTNGSTSPYPSTGSPTATNRIVSIANANNYTHPDYGQSSYYQGNPKTTFVDPDDKGMTLLNGNSVYLMTKEGDSGNNAWQNAMFFGGRGTSNASAVRGNLHGLYFYNDRDDIGSGGGIVGSLGSFNHSITVPYLGDSLDITATGNGIKFNGGYGSTGATIDTNGNISTDGKIITNDLDITAPSGSDAVLKFIQDGSSYASWKIRADGGDDAVMYFNQYNGSNTATGTIAFTSTGGILATGAGSYGNGFANGGVSISSNGNYQGAGNINITGTLTQGSDARLKTDVETIDGSKVFDMRGVSFTKEGKKGAGVIAQELQEIAPELVHEDQDGVLSVAYGDVVGYLIEAIKTLKQEIESIKADD